MSFAINQPSSVSEEYCLHSMNRIPLPRDTGKNYIRPSSTTTLAANAIAWNQSHHDNSKRADDLIDNNSFHSDVNDNSNDHHHHNNDNTDASNVRRLESCLSQSLSQSHSQSNTLSLALPKAVLPGVSSFPAMSSAPSAPNTSPILERLDLKLVHNHQHQFPFTQLPTPPTPQQPSQPMTKSRNQERISIFSLVDQGDDHQDIRQQHRNNAAVLTSTASAYIVPISPALPVKESSFQNLNVASIVPLPMNSSSPSWSLRELDKGKNRYVEIGTTPNEATFGNTVPGISTRDHNYLDSRVVQPQGSCDMDVYRGEANAYPAGRTDQRQHQHQQHNQQQQQQQEAVQFCAPSSGNGFHSAFATPPFALVPAYRSGFGPSASGSAGPRYHSQRDLVQLPQPQQQLSPTPTATPTSTQTQPSIGGLKRPASTALEPELFRRDAQALVILPREPLSARTGNTPRSQKDPASPMPQGSAGSGVGTSASAGGVEDKRFTCDECGMVFSRRDNMKVHLRKHTGEKPYACPYTGCTKVFRWNSSMNYHLSTHKRPAAPSSNPATNNNSNKN